MLVTYGVHHSEKKNVEIITDNFWIKQIHPKINLHTTFYPKLTIGNCLDLGAEIQKKIKVLPNLALKFYQILSESDNGKVFKTRGKG